LIRATLALIRYLADMRFKVGRWLSTEDVQDDTGPRVLYSLSTDSETTTTELEDDPDLESAAELVDTTLFRAYMFCRPQLVGPLVRRPNRCVPSIVQEMLEQAHVFLTFELPDIRNTEISRSSYLAKGYIDRH